MTEISRTDKFSLLGEWFDPESSILRKFYFFFFPSDNTVELYDIKNRRTFLKRTTVEGLKPTDIFVGNSLKIFSRQIRLVDFANAHTKKIMGVTMQKTFVLIRNEAIEHKGKILKAIVRSGMVVSKLKMLKLNQELATELLATSQGSTNFPFMVKALTSGPVVALELVADDGVNKFLELAGPGDPEVARTQNPNSLRARFGKDSIYNAIYASESVQSAFEEISLLFGKKTSITEDPNTSTVLMENSTCCIIKPHAIKEGHLGDIVDMIETEGYKISAMQMFFMENVNAEEFYEVYKGVVQEYAGMVAELVSGGCVAMEITGPMGSETPTEFRKFVGPNDPDIARQLRPNTLRAVFGRSVLQNAVHVTDLPEDALLEVEYFFKILPDD